MNGYYCISDNGNEFLYVPLTLFSYCSNNVKRKKTRPKHRFDIRTLSKIASAMEHEKITRDRLMDLEWLVCDVNIPDKFVKRLRYLCSQPESDEKESRAISVANKMLMVARYWEEYYENALKKEIVHEGGYKEIVPAEDEEDKQMDWWKRGESWDEDWNL